MATTLEILTAGASAYTDFSDFLSDDGGALLKKSWPLNSPQTLVLALKEASGFVNPARHNPLRFTLNTYGSSAQIFTGFIVNDPEKSVFAQESDGVVRNVWKLTCISEEYALDVAAAKEFHRVPPFRSQTVGSIIRYLLSVLAPGRFDVTGVDEGIVVPTYNVTVDMNFTDVVRDLVESAGMKFWTREGKAFLKYLNDAASVVTIDQTSADWDPEMLHISPRSSPIYNDVIAFGGILPGPYVREYFVGDGLTMRWSLSNRVYGAKKSVILTDDMNSGAVDTSLWDESDPTSNIVPGPSLYVDGGAGYDLTKLVARSALEFAGTILFQHGAIRFTDASSGIIGGLWASGSALQPSSCFLGFLCAPSGTQTKITPLVSGVAPSGSTNLVTEAGYDYILQTLVQAPERLRRQRASFSLVTPTGMGGQDVPSNAWVCLRVLRVSQSDPSAPPTAYQIHTGAASGTPGFVTYAPFNSVNLNLAANFLFVSTPVDVLAMTRSSTASGFTTLNLGFEREFDKDGAIVAGKANNSDLALFGTGLITEAPASGDAVEVRYRAAMFGAARVQSAPSIAAEASAMRDTGTRAKIITDIGFAARDEAELEWAAKAFMDDHLGPVYEGTFTFDTFKRPLASEPMPGRFITVASTGLYPSFSALITQVDMEYLKKQNDNTDIVRYTVSFGPLDTFEKLVSRLTKEDEGLLLPKEDSGAVNPIDFGLVGTGYAPNVPNAAFTYVYGPTFYQIDMGTVAPTGAGGDAGHFEIRYSDEGWGIPSGTNLIAEQPTQVGNMPRTSRIQQYWVRAIKPVNLALHSGFEDGVVRASGGGTSPPTATIDATGATDFSSLKVAWPTGVGGFSGTRVEMTGSELPGCPTGMKLGFRFKAKGSRALAGSEQIVVAPVSYSPLGTGLEGVTLSSSNIGSGFAAWAEYSLVTSPISVSGGYALFAYVNTTGTKLTTPFSLWIDDIQIEKSPPATANGYFRTTTNSKGFASRVSSLVQINWPLIPAAPATSVIDGTDRLKPKIRLFLPNNSFDVFGVRVKDQDNTTVLYDYADLSLAITPDDPALTLVYDNSGLNRTRTLYAYTYNLLKEYSPSLSVSVSLPAVVPSGLSVNPSGRLLTWTPNASAKNFEVTVSPSSDFSSPKATGVVTGAAFFLSIEDIVQPRYMRVRADDGLGYGSYASGFFTYTATGPTGFDNVSNVESVGFPPSPTADPTYDPPTWGSHLRAMSKQAWDDYTVAQERAIV